MSAAHKLTFELHPQADYLLIRLAASLEKEDLTALQSEVLKSLEAKPTDVLINLSEMIDVSNLTVRTLMQLHQKVRSAKHQMRIFGANLNIARYIKEVGLHGSLKVCPSQQAALVDMGLLKIRAVDVEFINPFLISTIKVLGTQASTVAKAGQAYRKQAQEKFTGDVSGVIGLTSAAFAGSVVISFPAATFLKIMERMTGEQYKEINKDISDGAGELTNIIFGQAKVTLNERGYGIETALPTVVIGGEHSVVPFTIGPRMVIPFETDIGPFFVEICISQ